MQIYFSGSITGGRGDVDIYKEIIDYLKQFGEVPTEYIGDANMGNKGNSLTMSTQEINERDMKWLMAADLLVAEISTPSLGVGYEIARASMAGKKIICLFRKQEDKIPSGIIIGDQKVIFKEYEKVEEVKEFLRPHLEEMQATLDK